MLDKNALLRLRKFLVPEIVYGTGALALAGRHAGNFGATKVLIVTDPGVQAAGWTGKVERSLRESNIPYAVFSDISSNPKDREVMAGAALCKMKGCDLILAVGGGSPMDCAKGIGVVVGNQRHILEFEGVDGVPRPGPPLIFVPTTAGTSADVSQFAIINDTARGVKIAVVSKMVIPDISLVDPETTVTLSPELTAASGMDALCHAFEAFVSTASSPLTDMAALSAVKLIAGNLEGAYREPENREFRDKMMMASLKAGLAFSNASLGLVHAMAHSMGGALDLSHGECNAMLLEKAVAYNYPAAREKYNMLAEVMGVDRCREKGADVVEGLVERIADLRKALGITQRLSDLGVSPGDITKLADFAAKDPCLATNPREACVAAIEAILASIY